MKPIHFRAQNYDPEMLARIGAQGHRQVVETKDIITMVAAGTFPQRVAVQVDSKFHLLIGAIDTKAPHNELHVISTVQLKKARVEPGNFDTRSKAGRDMRDFQASHAFNDYRDHPSGRRGPTSR